MTEIKQSDKADEALKRYLKSKGVNAESVWVDSEVERKFSGGCETCAYSYTETKYYLYWRTEEDYFGSSGLEEFDDISDLIAIAVEFS